MMTILSNLKVWVLAAIAALGIFANPTSQAAPSGGGGPTLDPITMLMVEEAVGAVVRDWVEGGLTPPAPGEPADPLIRNVNSTCVPGICTAIVSASVEGFAGTVDYEIVVVSGTDPDTAAILAAVECKDPDFTTTLPSVCSDSASACKRITLEGAMKRFDLFFSNPVGQSEQHTMATVVGEEGPGDGQSDCIPKLGGGQLFGESDTFVRESKFKGSDITLGEGHSVHTVDGTLAAKAFAQYTQDIKGSTGEISKTATECTVIDGDVTCDVQDQCSGPVSYDDVNDLYAAAIDCEMCICERCDDPALGCDPYDCSVCE